MKIKRRFPNYFSGFEETEHEVSSKEELLNLDWTKQISEDVKNHLGFFYAEKSFDDAPYCLMSLSRREEGSITYFVVGYIFGDPSEIGLKEYTEYIKNYKPKNDEVSDTENK